MPFGLSGAPGSFYRLMSIVLRDLLWVVCLCYLDDIVVFARSPQELLERLRIVLDRLRDVGLKAKPLKCELFKTDIKFLDHMVSADGINPLEAIRDWPVPPLLSRSYGVLWPGLLLSPVCEGIRHHCRATYPSHP